MNLNNFAGQIRQNREQLMSSWRGQVRALPSTKGLDTPTLNDHMPAFLEELAEAFEEKSNQTIAESVSEKSPYIHGLQRLSDGFDINEVVAEYNILRGCIHDFASQLNFALQGQPFRIMNRVFDKSIGVALETYAVGQARQIQLKREEYLAFVVHDLRTPLFAISLAVRMLERKQADQTYTNDCIKMIKSLQRSTKHLDSVVRKVLEENTHVDSEDGVKLQLRQFYIWPLIEALVEELQPVAHEGGITLRNNVSDEQIVYADAGALKRILQNLVGNALKHSPNGIVTISAEESKSSGFIEISVQDNGAGIPQEVLHSVFEKNVSNDQDEAVAGLGLAIVKMLVQAHGGSVSVESEPGKGSNFLVSLPSLPTTTTSY